MSRALHIAMLLPLLPLLALLALLAGCERPGENRAQTRRLAGKALSGTLAYPRSTLVSVSAGEEAAQLLLSSPASMEEVGDRFLRALRLDGWGGRRSGRGGEGRE